MRLHSRQYSILYNTVENKDFIIFKATVLKTLLWNNKIEKKRPIRGYFFYAKGLPHTHTHTHNTHTHTHKIHSLFVSNSIYVHSQTMIHQFCVADLCRVFSAYRWHPKYRNSYEDCWHGYVYVYLLCTWMRSFIGMQFHKILWRVCFKFNSFKL